MSQLVQLCQRADGRDLLVRRTKGLVGSLVGVIALLVVAAPVAHGASAEAARSGPARSFTLSAWVDLRRIGGVRTLVGQAGSRRSTFSMQLLGGRFAFVCRTRDSRIAAAAIASAGSIIPQPGEWYRLTGVYDAARRQIALYVNGTLAQVQAVRGISPDAGPVGAARDVLESNRTGFLAGSIVGLDTADGVLSRATIARLAGPGTLTVDASQLGPSINSTQFGAFVEEINHAGDGGLDGQLIRNSDMKEVWSSPAYWQPIESGGGRASIAVDGSHPLNAANPMSLRLTIDSLPAGGRVGVGNDGYWGIAVQPSTTYQVSFFAKSSRVTTGPLTVDLESDSGQVEAGAALHGLTNVWTQYSATLTTGAYVLPSLTNRFVISTSDPSAAGSTMWFTVVTVFPPSYDGLGNGLRTDLMQMLAALHPGFLRLPGGNYLEGDTVDSRFDWIETVGPLQDRPGHFNSPWGYWSDDYMGLLEYLEAAEEAGAEPLLAVWDGYALGGATVPQDQLAPYIEDAIDEIHYAVDPVTTPWGAMRAMDGHPAPFDLMGVEVGNEDQKDTSGSYNAYRYPMFYDAIKAAFPTMPVVATAPVTSRPADILDEHFYNTPAWFAENAHRFDSTSRTGPKVLIGEYEAAQGQSGGTLADAIGEAAFLTGLERDADVVVGASYAPLFANVNAPNWGSELIGYNALNSYGSASYYAQEVLSANHGDQVIGSHVVSGTGTLFEVASQDASHTHTYLAVVNDGARAAPTQIILTGMSAPTGGFATVLTGNPAAANSLANPSLIRPTTSTLGPLHASFGYTFAPNSVTVLQLDS